MDGWVKVIDEELGFYWEFWEDGVSIIACSDSFKRGITEHPKIKEEYNKRIAEQ